MQDAADPAAPPEPIIPDGCVEIVLNFGDLFVRHEPGGAVYRQPRRLVAGQTTGPVTVAPTGRVDLWGVRFHPWSGAAFLGLSAAELRERVEGLDASPAADRLLAPLGDEDSDAARGARLVVALERRARRLTPPAASLAELVRAAAGAREALSVRALARRAGVSARRVQTIFAEHVGLSPKTLLRIARFQRAVARARSAPRLTWARVAADAGYHDHAHLVKECRALAGCAPGELARGEAGLAEAGLTEAFLAR